MEPHFPSSESNSPEVQAAMEKLRARAERNRLVALSMDEKSPEEVRMLAQELQIHQIELEMQYEELQRAQAESEAMRSQYVDLYDFAPVGYCTLSGNGEIRQLNLHLSQLLGLTRQQLLRRRFGLFVSLATRNTFHVFLENVLGTGQRQTCALELGRHDGSKFYARLEGLLFQSDAGEPHCRLVVIDITAQHQVEEALRASELRFRTLFEQSTDAVVLVESGRYTNCNLAALRLLGAADKRQLVGKSVMELSPERQPNGQLSRDMYEQHRQLAEQEGSFRSEWWHYRLTGEEIWLEVVSTPLQVDGHAMMHVVWRDITERKHNEQRLTASEERLRLALLGSGTGVWEWQPETNELYWDQRAQDIVGHPFDPSPVVFSRLTDAMHPEDLPRATAVLQQALREHQPFDLEHRVIWPDGSIHHVTVSGQVLASAPRRLTGLIHDVTVRRRQQQELNYKNRVLEHILRNMPVVLARTTPDGTLLEMVGQGLRRMNIDDNELVGRNVAQVYRNAPENLRALLEGKRVGFISNVLFYGELLHYQNFGFYDEQQQQVVLFSLDVTTSEQVKAQLRSEKEFTERLLDSSVDVIAALDQSGVITAWNRTAALQTGLEPRQALGQCLWDTPLGNSHPELRELVELALAGEPVTRLALKDVSSARGYSDLYLVPLTRADENIGALLIMRDVTEREELLAETTRLKLRQQKAVLEAILTAQEDERRRIAEALHNGVGQLLYAIKLHLEHTVELPRSSSGFALLDEAIRATRGISFELTPGVLEDFGLETAVKELVKRIPKPPIRLHSRIPRDLPKPLQIAMYRIAQELLNNVMKHAQAGEVFIYLEKEHGHLHLSVEDDGVGFNSRELGQVKGIGLNSIRSRVELLNGQFTLESRVGHGTIVTIQLPIA